MTDESNVPEETPSSNDGGDAEALEVSDISEEPEDYFEREIERRREFTRVWITAVLLGIFGITVFWVLYVVTFADSAAWENTKEALQIVLPVEASLLGAAITFYFTSYRDQ